MTLVEALPPHPVTIKGSNQASYIRFLSIITIAISCTVTYFLVTIQDTLGDPSDEFVIKNIPKYYTKLEVLDPEDREVFSGFKTSFLPHDETVLHRGDSKNVFEGNVTSDILIWGGLEKVDKPTRVKRMSHFSITSLNKPLPQNSKDDSTVEDYSAAYPEGETGDEYDPNDSRSDQNKEDQSLESVVPHELHVDRGPLDDVVEQVRGQPELEEEEMGSSAHIYKPAKSSTVIHAFWKGQGDRRTIRQTQAHIMKQYMDAGADPCHDFYQYACGNWPALNPIPADKAGYDTFEMLRENLDNVLKDLLEFKHNEDILYQYPGKHLQLNDNFLEQSLANFYKFKYSLDKLEQELDNSTESHNYDIDDKKDRSEIISRIRRYLDRKSKGMMLPFKKLDYKIHKTIRRNKKIQKPNSKMKSRRRVQKYQNKPSRQKKSARRKKYAFKEYNTSISVNRGRKLLLYESNNLLKARGKRNGLFYKAPSSHGIDLSPNVPVKNENYDDDPALGQATMKARFLFRSCMDYGILQRRGHQPLLDLLDLLGGWPILDKQWRNDNFDWLGLMASLRLYNNDILISEWVGPDIKNSDEFVIQFDQTSLGLPTRDYFLQESNKVYLDAYKKYLITIALLLGGEPNYVKESADELIEFEKRLALITSAPEERRNVSELYRRMSLRKLEKLVPEVDWRRYLCIVMNRTVKSQETVVLFALTYVRHLVNLVEATDAKTLSNYLLWRFVRHRVNNLDDRFQSAKQQFYFILFGREQAPPRWKNCISQVNSNMGMALGSMFVSKYFDETSKNDTMTMTREIQKSFRELLHMTDWIDGETKKLAAHKVDAMMLRIGYPDFIRHKAELNDRYKEVKIYPAKYFENILNILQHLTKMEQSRIGQPVNKTLWNTAPAVVNAYYSRNKNQIMFPAGILQPPFYHRHFPRSLNYGGIGVVIGHEITHGFDDKGRLFDCNGNLHRWWSDGAIEAFHTRAQCLIDQYGKYVVPEVNIKLDGVNTQGENIADNGGVKQAFRAYLRWLKKHGSEGETLPGLNHTHTQLFFLNFAQVWCGAMRPEAMRNKLKTAVHAPGRFRVIGTLSNSHDFAKVFSCPPGSPMNPTKKCSVW